MFLQTCSGHCSTDPTPFLPHPLTVCFSVWLAVLFLRFASDYSESSVSCSVHYEHGELTVPFFFVTVFKHVKGSANSPLPTTKLLPPMSKTTISIYIFFSHDVLRPLFSLTTLLWVFSSFSVPWSSLPKAGNDNLAEALIMLNWVVEEVVSYRLCSLHSHFSAALWYCWLILSLYNLQVLGAEQLLNQLLCIPCACDCFWRRAVAFNLPEGI